MTVQEEYYVMTAHDMVGVIGGNLGVFIGFSFLDFIYTILDYIKIPLLKLLGKHLLDFKSMSHPGDHTSRAFKYPIFYQTRVRVFSGPNATGPSYDPGPAYGQFTCKIVCLWNRRCSKSEFYIMTIKMMQNNVKFNVYVFHTLNAALSYFTFKIQNEPKIGQFLTVFTAILDPFGPGPEV